MNPLIGELENLISDGLKKHPLPLVKGNSIRIANVVIRYSKSKGFLLFDCKKQIPLGTLNHKASAIGFALKYVKNNGYSKIFDLDDKLLKHHNDCMFYEHTCTVEFCIGCCKVFCHDVIDLHKVYSNEPIKHEPC